MSEKMFDLEFAQLEDGTVRLTQTDYAGESYIIDLHPAQLRHIAERAGVMSIGSDGIAARRLLIVADRLTELACTEFYRDEIMERCALGGQFLTDLDGVRFMADEFVRDLGEQLTTPPPTNLLRRLHRILDDADGLFRFLAAVPSFPPSDDEDEDVARCRRLVEDVEDLLADLDVSVELKPVCHEKSTGIIVKPPDASKPGHPVSGQPQQPELALEGKI